MSTLYKYVSINKYINKQITAAAAAVASTADRVEYSGQPASAKAA